ncbi:molybdopterin-dependent oxidoreductase [Ktedonospora formicarum]|uniref:Sulfite oxidase n=1 Tax=Ktedonospora formicarum TaxID=2778364 RepID=A0A8J3MRV4_9CHLR|nr:molybdopterin-dependent oxidoreductase [Ktedonospora formicarum]GHO43978.1 hypothetical protein KSX_21410 [Ktedonospora formicarum]
MQTHTDTRQERFASGFIAGLAAGILATGVMLLLNILLNGVSLPEEVGGAITRLMPASIFDALHRLIGADAKRIFVAIVVAGQCAVFGLIGGLVNLATTHPVLVNEKKNGAMRLGAGIFLALILWLASGLLLLPLVGAGIFGAQLSSGTGGTMWSLGLVGLIYGVLYVLLRNWFRIREQIEENQPGAQERRARAKRTRRDILRNGGIIVGVGVMGILAWRFISNGINGANNLAQLTKNFKRKIIPAPTPNYGTLQPAPGLSSEITSNDRFYTVSKNLVSDPTVNASSWHLEVKGEVAHPFTLTYDELLKIPTKQQYESLMCISNEVGGPYMGNALWDGFPLSALFERAGGVKTGATKVVLRAADDYSDSIHLSKALEPTTLVAIRMNGETLPQLHGFPARLLVPGIYGMKHVKWITSIEVVNYDFRGYWQGQGWNDAAPIRMTSRIDTPRTDTSLKAGQKTYIAGVAFSGNKGISEVDVSLDNGATWQRTTLKKPITALTWVLWELPWTPKEGDYTVIARAVDLEGNVQDPNPASPAPDGSSGYHTVSITVR